MRKVLKDPLLEKEFQEKGYVILPFLNDKEINDLTDTYFKSLSNSGGRLGPENKNYKSDKEITYDFTFIDKNIAYKKEVFSLITEVFDLKYKDILNGYTPIIANYIRKKDHGGEVPLHQNWAFVDEMTCTSVSIWCPLRDSNKKNGTLEVVPGSHKRFGQTRGPMIPSELSKIENEIIEQYMIPLELKAGEIVILDDSIVHYSSPNETDGLRLAIQLILIPSEKPSIHHYYDNAKNTSKVEVLEVDHDFYMSFDPWKKPADTTPRINLIPLKINYLTLNDFSKKLKAKRFDRPTVGQKILNYFIK
jgi:hypothetical protein